MGAFHQQKLEQNLRGKNGIIGRTVEASFTTPNGIERMGCCTIGEDMAPMAATDPDGMTTEPDGMTTEPHAGHQYGGYRPYQHQYRPSYLPQQKHGGW